MTNISHLQEHERVHYIRCHCGHFIDMRDLENVFSHQHEWNLPAIEWKYAVRKGQAFAYTKSKLKKGLN